MVIVRGWGKGEYGESVFTGYSISLREDEKVLELDGMMVA